MQCSRAAGHITTPSRASEAKPFARGNHKCDSVTVDRSWLQMRVPVDRCRSLPILKAIIRMAGESDRVPEFKPKNGIFGTAIGTVNLCTLFLPLSLDHVLGEIMCVTNGLGVAPPIIIFVCDF
ncbi:hypothetical protein B0J14DRAFT_159928 [Halenospora varia]|nr:hypothetical protein B0J14DRAFT_159928 [Halenospora varia]